MTQPDHARNEHHGEVVHSQRAARRAAGHSRPRRRRRTNIAPESQDSERDATADDAGARHSEEGRTTRRKRRLKQKTTCPTTPRASDDHDSRSESRTLAVQLRVEGHTQAAIATLLHVCQQTIARWLGGAPRTRPDRADHAEIRRLRREEHLSQESISRRSNTPQRTVSDILHGAPRVDHAEIGRVRRDEGLSQEAIARRSGASRRSVCRILHGAPRGDNHVLWVQEHNEHTFALLRGVPAISDVVHGQNVSEELKWISDASWTFCPDCGRRRPDGKFQAQDNESTANAVRGQCDPCCDHPPHVLEEEQEAFPV